MFSFDTLFKQRAISNKQCDFPIFPLLRLIFYRIIRCKFENSKKRKIMERIVFEVDGSVATTFYSIDEEKRKMINDTVNLWLKKITNDMSFKNYSQLLDDLSDEAEKNGLTPEILEELLKDD